MAQIVVNSPIGSALCELLLAPDITPGMGPSYNLCKAIYLYHPLGGKMAKTPILLAQSQDRKVTVPGAPDCVVEEFLAERKRLRADATIRNAATLARVYGISTLVIRVEGEDSNAPLDMEAVADPAKKVTFSVFDPLNTAGSLVGNLDPNSVEFLSAAGGVTVQGTTYHPSRTCVILNEEPIYLAYSESAWGYVGRSVYQRALLPLKSFVQTMIADDMVSRKAGLIVAKIQQAGSIIDATMALLTGLKRAILKEAITNQVLSIGITEEISAIDLQNVNAAMKESRDNILKNAACAADMPAKLLDNETFVEGFGEGTEDAKNVARYVDGVRQDLEAPYRFIDDIAMRRAWSPAYYKTIQNRFPDDYGDIAYEVATQAWRNAFTAEWPSLLKEPESEEVKVTDVKLKAVIAMVQVLAPELDPENKSTLLQWAADNVNELKLMFGSPLTFDFGKLDEFLAEQKQNADDAAKAAAEGGAEKEPGAAPPFSARDAVLDYDEAAAALISHLEERTLRNRARNLRELAA